MRLAFFFTNDIFNTPGKRAVPFPFQNYKNKPLLIRLICNVNHNRMKFQLYKRKTFGLTTFKSFAIAPSAAFYSNVNIALVINIQVGLYSG